MTKFACVWTGSKYPVQYVEHLRDNLPGELICYTDRDYVPDGVRAVDVRLLGLSGWWAKMALFNPRYRPADRVIYFDLDTVIAGDITPLVNLDVDFGVCANFTRRAGVKTWPCNYGSCVMSFRRGWGREVWRAFTRDQSGWMQRAGTYGDQWVVEKLKPDAVLLQDVLPDATGGNPGASVIIFAGNHKPDNCRVEWIRELWP